MSLLPAAGSPLSAFTPPRVGALPPPAGILTRRFDPTTGDLASGLLDSDTPGPTRTSALHVGDDPTDAAMLWQFMIRQGSGAALGDNGNRLHTITKATAQAPVQLRDEALRVARRLEPDVSGLDVQADTPGGATAIRAVQVTYTNEHTSTARTVKGGA